MTQTLCLDTYVSDPMAVTTYVSDPMAVTTYDSDTMPGHLCLRHYGCDHL
jgi:hypothetical protein